MELHHFSLLKCLGQLISVTGLILVASSNPNSLTAKRQSRNITVLTACFQTLIRTQALSSCLGHEKNVSSYHKQVWLLIYPKDEQNREPVAKSETQNTQQKDGQNKMCQCNKIENTRKFWAVHGKTLSSHNLRSERSSSLQMLVKWFLTNRVFLHQSWWGAECQARKTTSLRKNISS